MNVIIRRAVLFAALALLVLDGVTAAPTADVPAKKALSFEYVQNPGPAFGDQVFVRNKSEKTILVTVKETWTEKGKPKDRTQQYFILPGARVSVGNTRTPPAFEFTHTITAAEYK